MVALGLLLFALAALLTGGVVFSDSSSIDLTAFGVTMTAVPLAVLFVAGLLTGLVGVLGLGLLSRGAARRRALRREARLAKSEKTHLKAVNEQLSADLARERSRGAVHPEPYPAGPAAAPVPAAPVPATPKHRHARS